MNKLILYLKGFVRLRLHCGSCEFLLDRLAGESIAFWDVVWSDEVTVEICVFSKDWKKLNDLLKMMGCEISARKEVGFGLVVKRVCKRPVLVAGVILSFMIVLIAQNFILFFEVVGNENVPDAAIMQALDEIGIKVGIYGPNVRPKWIKDRILNALPQLQWITVVQNGSFAQVVVRERPQKPKITSEKGFANVVAGRAGIITSQSVLEGQALKKVGDAVIEGELLVSGVVDHDIKYSVVRAQAEIYARTWRTLSMALVKKHNTKRYLGGEHISLWLLSGKRRIKIYGNSGISYACCDKMIEKINLTLPGGHSLPISLVIERTIPYEVVEATMTEQQALWMLEDASVNAIMSRMTAGTITAQNSEMISADGLYRLNTEYECHEMIARTAEGKWNKEDFTQ